MLRKTLSITLLVALTLFVAGVPRAMHWEAEHADAVAASIEGGNNAQPTSLPSPHPIENDGEDDCPDCHLHKAGFGVAIGAPSVLATLELHGFQTPTLEQTLRASFALPGAGPRAPPVRI